MNEIEKSQQDKNLIDSMKKSLNEH